MKAGRTLASLELPLRVVELCLMLGLVSLFGLLVANLDEPVDEDLSVPHDGAEGLLAGEDLLEGGAVRREGLEVQALRVGARGDEL